jgi:hypothetical protein
MATSNERARALKLIEEEDRRAREHSIRQRQEVEESRIQAAVQRIRKQDAEAEKEERRRMAKELADELAVRRAELEHEADDHLNSLLRVLGDLRLLDEEHRATLREAGEYSIHDGLNAALKEWLRSHLSNLVVTDQREYVVLQRRGYPEPRSLAEIDPLVDTEGAL